MRYILFLLALCCTPFEVAAQGFGSNQSGTGFGYDVIRRIEDQTEPFSINAPLTLTQPTTFTAPVNFEQPVTFEFPLAGPGSTGQFIKKGGDSTEGKLILSSPTVHIPQDTPDYEEGKMWYHDNHFGIEVMTDVELFHHHLGQGLSIRFRNKTGSTLIAGSVVYQDGVQGQVVTMALAKADAFPQAAAVGVIPFNVSNNALGWVLSFGLIHDQNTSAFIEGDILFLSTSTAGLLTTTNPGGPLVMEIATVLISHANQGELNVHIKNETPPASGGVGSGVDDQGGKTSTLICASSCITHPGIVCRVVSTTDFDIYTSTGSGSCQFRNSRTGQGPLP